MLVVETHGTPYERGHQYGQQLAGEIGRRVPARPLRPRAGGDATAGERLAGQMLRYLERNEPAMVDEMRGLAAGAGVSFEAVVHLNVANSVQYIRDFPGPTGAPPGSGGEGDGAGCTNVAFATTERGALLGKTNDGGAPVPAAHQASTWVLQHVRPDGGPEYFLLATVGALAGVAGLNGAGFAVGQSAAQVVPGQEGYGVPSTLILRPLLERCATVGEAIDLLATRDLAGKGLNLMLLDAAGTVKAAEVSAGLMGVRTPDERGTLYFSNHCHTPGLRDLPPRHDRDNSVRRWSFLQRHLGDAGSPERGWEQMWDLIRRHGREEPTPSGESERAGAAPANGAGAPGAPGAICQHGPDMFTSLGLLIAPRERTLWTADGPPCSTPLVERRLGPSTRG
jgi:isopenicillin-N N-acyltransferase-like protein